MKIRNLLYEASSRLKETETPFLDAVVLLERVMNLSKEKIFASFPDTVSEEKQKQYNTLVDKRLNGIPVSYILNKKEFYGLDFYVDNRVLVPRPDTETIVEAAIDIIRQNDKVKKVHDLCTGSGCIAIALKYTCKEIKLSASDISPDAIEVFKKNNSTLIDEPIPVFTSNLLKNVSGKFDIITANPPYLKDLESKEMKSSGWPEPESALNGGMDGFDFILKIIKNSPDHLNYGGYLLIEGAENQMEESALRMKASGYTNINFKKDLSGRDRVISGQYFDGKQDDR